MKARPVVHPAEALMVLGVRRRWQIAKFCGQLGGLMGGGWGVLRARVGGVNE